MTSGANEMIFMNFSPRNSRVTGPKIRVPMGASDAFSKTAATDAVGWYEMAADRGLVLARANLARLLLEKARTAAERQVACVHLEAAAAAGDADSQWELHENHRLGRGCASRPDEAAARRWLVAAAESSHPGALSRLKSEL